MRPRGRGGRLQAVRGALDDPDPKTRARYGDATEARIDWRPDEPFHLFLVDIDSAGFISFGEKRVAMRWRRGEGLTRIKHPDDP
jgi:hypothetical protein